MTYLASERSVISVVKNCTVTNADVMALLGRGEQAPRTVKACLCGSFINERSAREDGWRPH